MKTISIVLALALAVTGFAIAHETAAISQNCKDLVADDEAGHTVDLGALELGTYYLDGDLNVWEESNGLAGLQTHDHECLVKHSANGSPIDCVYGGNNNKPACEVRTVAADTRVEPLA